ncbi:MAG: CopG family transcriptional regulator [Candidatus Asgardarchaeia archaeon]
MSKKNKAMTVRVQVLFTKEQYEIIQKLKGEMGLTDSEVIRNIVLNWLMEKSFISASLKSKLSKGADNE